MSYTEIHTRSLKKVDNIRVKVEYIVEKSDFEIPQELFNEIEDLERIDMTSDALMLRFPNVLGGFEELMKPIKEMRGATE